MLKTNYVSAKQMKYRELYFWLQTEFKFLFLNTIFSAAALAQQEFRNRDHLLSVIAAIQNPAGKFSDSLHGISLLLFLLLINMFKISYIVITDVFPFKW